MKFYFVYNSRSGSALSLKQLKQACQQAEIEVSEFIKVTTSYEARLKGLVKKDDIVAIYGGDGTVSSVISTLADKECVFAPLAGGTLNHFTKDLGIPQDITKALDGLLKRQPRRIDVAAINDTLFINNSSIGFYPLSLRTRERLTPRIGKWPAAAIGLIGALVNYRTYNVTIGNRHIRTPFIFVGNNDYRLATAGINGSRNHLDKGELSIYTIDATTITTFFALMGRLLFTKATKLPGIHVWKGGQVTIASRHKKHLTISKDGEVITATFPVVYKSLPKKIRIIGNS